MRGRQYRDVEVWTYRVQNLTVSRGASSLQYEGTLTVCVYSGTCGIAGGRLPQIC